MQEEMYVPRIYDSLTRGVWSSSEGRRTPHFLGVVPGTGTPYSLRQLILGTSHRAPQREPTHFP